MTSIRRARSASVLCSHSVKVALDLGVNPLAEGIETAAEADVCRKMGFLTAQGFHFGRPASLRQIESAEQHEAALPKIASSN